MASLIISSRGLSLLYHNRALVFTKANLMPFRAVFFDFDGTLADSFEAITASTNHVRSSFGLPEVPESVVREYVGFGLPNLMEHLVPGFDTNEAVARYRQHHPLVMFTGTRLMRGVA